MKVKDIEDGVYKEFRPIAKIIGTITPLIFPCILLIIAFKRFNFEIYVEASIGFLMILVIFFGIFVNPKKEILLKNYKEKINKLYMNGKKTWKQANWAIRLLLIGSGRKPSNIKGQYGFIDFDRHFRNSAISFIITILFAVVLQTNSYFSLFFIFPFWFGVYSFFYLIALWYYFLLPNLSKLKSN